MKDSRCFYLTTQLPGCCSPSVLSKLERPAEGEHGLDLQKDKGDMDLGPEETLNLSSTDCVILGHVNSLSL